MTYSGGVYDCANEPASMNAGRPGGAPEGCAGAVWESGAPSETYCNGVDPTDAGRDWKWWEVCCVWGVRVGEPTAHPLQVLGAEPVVRLVDQVPACNTVAVVVVADVSLVGLHRSEADRAE